MDGKESWNGRFVVDKNPGQHGNRRKGKCRTQAQVDGGEASSASIGNKSVLGKWLTDFRSGGQKAKKVRHPLGRTLSANGKTGQESKKKPVRTMSANQKEHRFVSRRHLEERSKCESCGRNCHLVFPCAPSDVRIKDESSRGFCLVRGPSEFYCSPSSSRKLLNNGSDLAVNPDALVSWLDEEGLNAAAARKRPSGSACGSDGDGLMMPATFYARCNRYEKNVASNEKNISRDRFKTEKLQLKDHDYENLKRRESLQVSQEDSVDSSRGCRLFRFGDDDEGGHQDDNHEEPDVDVNASEAPGRDPSSPKSVNYGPGHEKYPSWPGSLKTCCEKPQRSRSWMDRTDYPKEKVTSYEKPPNPTFANLKTVMERCENSSCQNFRGKPSADRIEQDRVYLPKVDREGKSLGDEDYMVPSPPERDEPYGRSRLEIFYRGDNVFKDEADYSMPYQDVHKARFTRADLEEYARSYEEIPRTHHHQHEGSYAQSEGYHSYVSSSELAIAPFSDKSSGEQTTRNRWEEEGSAGRDSVVTTSSGSAGSNETLKWHGSMSDVSVGASSCSKSRQLIAHSSRVPAPQRHHSESILYLKNGRERSFSKEERSQHLKLFPVNTYTVRPFEETKSLISPTCVPRFSVADRISELERQQQFHKLSYLDPDKRHRVSDPTLKAIQKKALLSFYERHQHSSGLQAKPSPSQDKSGNVREQEMNEGTQNLTVSRRCDDKVSSSSSPIHVVLQDPRGSVVGFCKGSPRPVSGRPRFPDPLNVFPSRGPGFSEESAPERPPKKPHSKPVPPPPLPPRSPSPVRNRVPEAGMEEDRIPTPDLPPPPFPPSFPEDETPVDEPLPPPPPEAEWLLATAVPGRSSPFISVARLECDSEEIQYDQNAINAIMERNRVTQDFQKRKSSSKSSMKDKKNCSQEDDKLRKNGVENRPPLPLPRDALPSSFFESSKSIRAANLEMEQALLSPRGKFGYQFKKYSRRLPKSQSSEENFVNEISLRLEKEEERFRRLFLERTNSKAAFLAVRREKELGLSNYEGSYKLTISPSGEFLNSAKASSSSSLSSATIEKIETSTEKVILEGRLSPLSHLSPEPPDLIPLGDLRSRRSSLEFPQYDDRRFHCVLEENKDLGNDSFRKFLGSRREEDSCLGKRKEIQDVSEEADFLPKPQETAPSVAQNFSDVRNEEFSDRDDAREESECERLSRDLASQLPSSDKLQGLLVLDSERKRSTDYVAGLFRLEPCSGTRRRNFHESRARKHASSYLMQKSLSVGKDSVGNGKGQCFDASDSETSTGTKAPNCRTKDYESPLYYDPGELAKKKEELMASLGRKLEILRQERIALSEECAANEELGATVAASVSRLARPSESAKYRLHVEETGKITSLLLGLSGRLARTENVLSGLPLHDEERKTYESKRTKLKEQLVEAKQLKENIDKRSDSVAKLLEKYLSKDEFADYLHFIQMKAKLIVDSREITDKISLGEEQLAALKETLSS